MRMKDKKQTWLQARKYTAEQVSIAKTVLEEIRCGAETMEAIRSHPLSKGGFIAKHALVAVYRKMVEDEEIKFEPRILKQIRMKPMRTLSGVTTVTVLTKPYTCPGNCIFCPNDDQLPKSYVREEPGAERAFQNDFDPYRQVLSRIESYQAIGHPTQKIELLILGGCWTAYPQEYQESFIKSCLDAMNGKRAKSLEQAQKINESAEHRNIGLVVETRPDEITPAILYQLRHFGVTKIQLGAQSFQDEILRKNKRGHSVHDTLRATALLRAAGFKIVLHWMPNLLGATLESDHQDFELLWKSFCPDELKIYPTQLLESAELYAYWKRGEYQPYTTKGLIHLIADLKPMVPIYCRINRIIRDIPADYIVAGNKRSSLRQDIKREMAQRGTICRCIRCREIRGKQIDSRDLNLDDFTYQSAFAEEHFLHFLTSKDRLAGFLRLSLPYHYEMGDFAYEIQAIKNRMPELQNAAIIREIHVYGQSLEVGDEIPGIAQHSGLGTKLLEQAQILARIKGFKKLCVISAIGTRQYYEKRGFKRGESYMYLTLN